MAMPVPIQDIEQLLVNLVNITIIHIIILSLYSPGLSRHKHGIAFYLNRNAIHGYYSLGKPGSVSECRSIRLSGVVVNMLALRPRQST